MVRRSPLGLGTGADDYPLRAFSTVLFEAIVIYLSGLFRYWASGPRARSASLSLLSGRESRLRAFVAEFLSVLGESAVSVLGGADDTALEGGRNAAVRGLARTAYEQLRRTATLVYNDAQRRPMPGAGLFAPPQPRRDAATRGASARGVRW